MFIGTLFSRAKNWKKHQNVHSQMNRSTNCDIHTLWDTNKQRKMEWAIDLYNNENTNHYVKEKRSDRKENIHCMINLYYILEKRTDLQWQNIHLWLSVAKTVGEWNGIQQRIRKPLEIMEIFCTLIKIVVSHIHILFQNSLNCNTSNP
jgi:hypothetical protein